MGLSDLVGPVGEAPEWEVVMGREHRLGRNVPRAVEKAGNPMIRHARSSERHWSGQPETRPRDEAAGVCLDGKSGGPHAGSASGLGSMLGWRCTRAARNSPGGVLTRQAAPCSSKAVTPCPDCSGLGPDRPRKLRLARSGTDAVECSTCPPQARPGPAALARMCHGVRPALRPGGWLCTAVPEETAARQRSRDGNPPPRSRRATSARRLRGIPSRLHRNVRDPSGSWSEAIMAWGWRVWMKWGVGLIEG
jgi:hypothetical protein